ncbi:Ni/Fe hydrogenase subunit alpha [Candidatus Leptofilum sp.]|uniref:Ni/Fe hydrogenase subunit alpha n=1 Tax=Candidatus Leptofilum sp. TaxID=3241576 RepID=UPI003B5C209C
MSKRINIDVHHITRVEGHGNIVVDVVNGELKQCELQVTETPRFFEAMLRERPYAEASLLTSRICGICAVGHATTSLRATEKALGIDLSEQTQLLRRLNFMGEMLDSHILHAYMLVAPDLLNVGSVFPLAKTAPEVVLRALRMKKLAGDICQAIGGRHTHPIAMTVGGFTHFPKTADLYQLREAIAAIQPDVVATVELYQSLELPQFERETEYMALRRDDMYGFIDGDIVSSDGGRWPVEAYLSVTNEVVRPHSSAKHCSNQRDSYMVGALSRFNLNADLLHPQAKAAAEALGLKPRCTNPFMNTVAQVVEVAHCLAEAEELLDKLLQTEIAWEEPAPPTRLSGEGVGACEVPRGTLFHHYVIDNGKITAANCIIPTNQNVANIEGDMRAMVPTLLDLPQPDIAHRLEMLVRAYDPCISCSTHLLDVTFEGS